MIKWYSRHFVFWYFKKSIDLLDSLNKWENFYLVALSPKPIRLIFITCTTIKMYFLIKRYYMYQFKLHFSFLYTQSYTFLRFIACKFKMKTKPDMLKTIIFLLQLLFEESIARFSSYFDTLTHGYFKICQLFNSSLVKTNTELVKMVN